VTPVLGLLLVVLGATPPFADAGRGRNRQSETAGVSAGATDSSAATAARPETAPQCGDCQPRLSRALLETVAINVAYGLGNLARGQSSARITPVSWWRNLERGWEWDLDDFMVNQLGHPYQGSNYFNAGRSNGLGFWTSAAVAAVGSGTWEYFGETNRPSLNDFINTTLGGVALGEMFHRTAWLIRDPRADGRRRVWNEIAAAAIDPISGVHRLREGDVGRPEGLSPSTYSASASGGVLWRGSNTGDVAAKGQPFVEFDLTYGDSTRGISRTPYDAYTVRFAFGGGGVFSEARVRGRLLGQPLRGGRVVLNVVQDFDFSQNDAYEFGAQAVAVKAALVGTNRKATALWADAWGGATLLGTVDSRARTQPATAGNGVRKYDYGPGSNFGASAGIRRDSRLAVTATYDVHHLYVLNGARANHVLQRVRADLLLPVRGRLGLGVSGEFFDRRTFYQHEGGSRARFHYPQFRAYFTWHASSGPASATAFD
jgi:hypothetical protein